MNKNSHTRDQVTNRSVSPVGCCYTCSENRTGTQCQLPISWQHSQGGGCSLIVVLAALDRDFSFNNLPSCFWFYSYFPVSKIFPCNELHNRPSQNSISFLAIFCCLTNSDYLLFLYYKTYIICIASPWHRWFDIPLLPLSHIFLRQILLTLVSQKGSNFSTTSCF